MKDYIGVKHIKARPMTLGDYNNYRGFILPGEDGLDADGYLVEYTDGGDSNHIDHENYISWSPKDVFDKAYHEIHNHADPHLVIMDMVHTLKESVS